MDVQDVELPESEPVPRDRDAEHPRDLAMAPPSWPEPVNGVSRVGWLGRVGEDRHAVPSVDQMVGKPMNQDVDATRFTIRLGQRRGEHPDAQRSSLRSCRRGASFAPSSANAWTEARTHRDGWHRLLLVTLLTGNHTRRIPHDRCPWRHVARHDRARSNDGMLANGNGPKQDRVRTDADVVPDL
jgi:hypothetical protein